MGSETAGRAGKKKAKKSKKAGKARSGKPAGRKPDPSDSDDTETRFVQPYEANKFYLCPGCNGDIPPGMGHLVAVPRSAPDLRRHWHRGCWVNRGSRF